MLLVRNSSEANVGTASREFVAQAVPVESVLPTKPRRGTNHQPRRVSAELTATELKACHFTLARLPAAT